VNCTRYTDDLNSDTSGEYTVPFGIPLWDTANGRVYTNFAGSNEAYFALKSTSLGTGVYESSGVLYTVDVNVYYFTQLILWSGQTTAGGDPKGCVRASLTTQSSGNNFYLRSFDAVGAQTLIGQAVVPTVAGGHYTIQTTVNVSTGAITSKVFDSSRTVIGTVSGTTAWVTPGTIGGSVYGNGGRVAITNIIANALESTSNNGVAYTLGGMSHGARYDTQEEVYRTTTSASQLNARLNCTLISPNYASANCQWYYENITDSTSVDVDTVTKTVTITMSASPEAESRSTLVLGASDIGDTIKFAIRRKDYSGTSYDNQPAVLVDSNLKFTGTLTVTDSVNATDLITSRIRTTLSDSVASTDAITSRLRHTFTDSVNATDLITSRLRTTQSDSVNATDLVLSRLRTTVTDSVGLSDVAYSHLFAYVILHNYLTRTVVQHNQLRG
jgi:hypothetical protein